MICVKCETEFKPNKAKFQEYCNWACWRSSFKKEDRFCQGCGEQLTKRSQQKFCSKSCATTHNNKNKTTGTRRSKLEQYIEEELTILFPTEEILFNQKSTIGSELDIYVPRLHLAFEINGVFHYKPIFGEAKLSRIRELDISKKEACKQQGITLIEVDTSSQLQFSKESSLRYLEEIVKYF